MQPKGFNLGIQTFVSQQNFHLNLIIIMKLMSQFFMLNNKWLGAKIYFCGSCVELSHGKNDSVS